MPVYWLPHPATVDTLKVLSTAAVWLAYAVALTLRLAGALPARRLAWACVMLFGAALRSRFAVNSSRHPPSPAAAVSAP